MILQPNITRCLLNIQHVIIVCVIVILSGCADSQDKSAYPSSALAQKIMSEISRVNITESELALTQEQLKHYLANPKLITTAIPSFDITTVEQQEEKSILHIQGFSRRVHQLDVFNVDNLDDFEIPLNDRDNIIGYTFEYKGYIDHFYFSSYQDKTQQQLPLRLYTTPITNYRIQLVYQNGQTYDFNYRSVINSHSGRHSFKLRDNCFSGTFPVTLQADGQYQLQPFPMPTVDLIPHLAKTLPGTHIIKDGHAYSADKKLAIRYLSSPNRIIQQRPPAFDIIDIQEKKGKFYLSYKGFGYNLSDIAIYGRKDYAFYGLSDKDPIMGYLFDYQAEIVDIAYQSFYDYQNPNFSLLLFTQPQTPLYIQFLYADGRIIKKKYQSKFYVKESPKERFSGFNGQLSIYRDKQSNELTILKF